MACPGSVALSEGIPDTSSEYSREGTAAHTLASTVLQDGTLSTASHLGEEIEVEGHKVRVDVEMVAGVQTYVDDLLQYASPEGAHLYVEVPVPIDHVTLEKDAKGTADGVIIIPAEKELQVHDLKYGRGVRVLAERNEQLMMYALGALREFELVWGIERIRMVVHQPRLNHLDEWDCSIEELRAFAGLAQKAAVHGMDVRMAYVGGARSTAGIVPHLFPGEKQCRFCPAKAICPALAEEVEEVVGVRFDDLTQPAPTPPTEPPSLSAAMKKVGLVEDWCKAVRAELERQLFDGVQFNDWKLVMGKKGNREWADPAAAEALLRKSLKVPEIFKMTLNSPPAIEKVLAKTKPKRWALLQPLVIQRDGQPSVAPASDQRDPWVPPTGNEMFTNLNASPPEESQNG
jgi:hypothetical protein